MKKKYLFIYGELNGGGAERVLLDILDNFDYSKFEVDLCQINAGGTLIDQLPSSVKVFQLWKNYSIIYRIALRLSIYFGINIIFKKKLFKATKNKRYDVAISFLEGMPLKIHALATTIAKKNYTWVHCDIYKYPYEKGLFRKREEVEAYSKMDKIICVSQECKCNFGKRFNELANKTSVIYNPIDQLKINRLSLEENIKNKDFTIISVGRLVEQKAMHRIINLAKRLKDNGINIKFQILGDGILKQSLLDLSNRLEVSDRVEFLNYKLNPYPQIKAADLLLCCSISEGFCLVICEAMCLKVPVISTNTTGPNEILGNNEYGFICENDEESIYTAVKEFITNESLRNRYVEKGLNRISKFNMDEIMNEIYSL